MVAGFRGRGGSLAISKRKALETAQKYVQKGAFDKALKEYLKHLKAEPDDTNARLKLGDLHLKRGDPAAAIEAYGQVALLFSKGGFDAKAVAIYKQVLRIDPEHLDAHVKLGDHFQRMSLNKDALREFQESVKICQERGLKTQAFGLLKRVSALDPNNVPNRLSLADLFVREGMKTEARAEFESLLAEVAREAEGENLERVSRAMIEAFPKDERAHCALASARLKLGMSAEAVEALHEVASTFPESIEVRERLVEALEATGDAEAAKSIYSEIAELFKRRGDHDKAREILQRHVPVEGFGSDESDSEASLLLDELHEDTPPSDPEGSLDLEPTSHADGVKPPSKGSDPERPASDLIAEARVALEFGDPEGARASVEKLLELDPNSVEGRKLLAKLGRGAARGEEEALDEPGFDSLPDIELVLEDEDTGLGDEYASIEPPPELELTETVDGDRTKGISDAALVTEKLGEADEFFEAGELEQAEAAYREVLELAPNHPQAMVRLGEIEAEQGMDPSERESSAPESAPRDKAQVSVDDGFEFEFEEEEALLVQAEPAIEVEEVEVEVEAEPIVEVDSEPEPQPEVEPQQEEKLIDADYFADVICDDTEDPPTPDDFDLAAELDGEAGGTSEEDFKQVFDAFKKGVQEQIGEDESEAHYDLAIAYKEMGLLDDAIEQLDLVRRSGRLQIESLSLMAICEVEAGRPQQAAGHLSEALGCVGDGDDVQVSLRYELGEALVAAGKHGEGLEAFQKVAGIDAKFRDVQQRISELGG